MRRTLNTLAPSLAPVGRLREPGRTIGEAAAETDWLHVDIMDVHFVSDPTSGPPVIASLRKGDRTGASRGVTPMWPREGAAHRIRVYFELVQCALWPKLIIIGGHQQKDCRVPAQGRVADTAAPGHFWTNAGAIGAIQSAPDW